MSLWRSRRTLWVCAALVVLILLLWRPGADRFRSRLEQSLSSALGHRVEIGSVSLQILPRPGFNFSQLSVHDDPQFSLEPILRAEEVSATLHPSSLWRWRIEIANLSFKDASLNLVRRTDGRWNLEPLLERAAHAPAAPTGNAVAEVRRRFPYIEVSNARVNLKLGAEKMPYALTDADLALFLESTEEWGMRLRGQPVRTDMRLSDTGILRANATWRRAADLRKTPLRLTATYDGAQLGQFTKLAYGADKGWRGTVSATMNLTGSAEDLQIQSETSVDNFRRYDILSGSALRISAACTARYNISSSQLSEILCSTPAQDGSLLLRGKIQLSRPPAYDLNLNAAKFPAQRLMDVLRTVKKGLPDDLSATGVVNADLSFERDGTAAAIWSGNGSTDRLVLRSSTLQTKSGDDSLKLGTIPFRAVANTAAGGRNGRNRDAINNGNKAQPPGNALELGPITVNLEEDQKANFQAWFSTTGYGASFAGDTTIQRLLQIARAAGATGIHPALEGDAQFEWHASGVWGGFAAPQTTATLHLQNARAEFPGLNAPLAIATSDITLTADTFKLEKLSAAAGGIHWSGTLSRPRICSSPTACPTQIDLYADEVSVEKLNSLLNPTIHKQPWYRILTGNLQLASALPTLSAQGTLHINHLTVGDLEADAVTSRVLLNAAHLHLSELRASVLGGRHVGDWQADFAKDPPEYVITGALENFSLPQLGKRMHSNWITGSAHATYAQTFVGWNLADWSASARGTLSLDGHDGALPHFGLSGSPLKFTRLRAEITTGKSLLVISQGKLENAQGIHEISGVASSGHKLDLKFQNTHARGFAISGTLEDPHVETLPAPISRR